MSKKHLTKQPLAVSGKLAQKVLEIGLDRYLRSIDHTTVMSKYAGSIEISDDEFSAMLQELKEDR